MQRKSITAIAEALHRSMPVRSCHSGRGCLHSERCVETCYDSWRRDVNEIARALENVYKGFDRQEFLQRVGKDEGITMTTESKAKHTPPTALVLKRRIVRVLTASAHCNISEISAQLLAERILDQTAAPQLLEALKMILPLAEAYLRAAPGDPDNAKLETARAAIHHAEEGQ